MIQVPPGTKVRASYWRLLQLARKILIMGLPRAGRTPLARLPAELLWRDVGYTVGKIDLDRVDLRVGFAPPLILPCRARMSEALPILEYRQQLRSYSPLADPNIA